MTSYKRTLCSITRVHEHSSTQTWLQTEVDDSDPSCLRTDIEHHDDGFDEVENENPVVAARRVVVTNAARVVDHKHDVSDADCSPIKSIKLH